MISQARTPKKKTRTTKTRTTKTSTSTTKTSAKTTSKKSPSLLSVVIHDLKTPLSSIIANADFLRSEVTDPDCADASEDIFAAGQQLHRMMANVHDLLTGGPQVESLQACPLQPLFGDHGDARGLRVLADKELLTRVLRTLQDNSQHHELVMRLAAEQRGQRVQIRISDDGKPIPRAHQQAALTERGYTDRHVAAQSRVGLGFGLYFCRMAIEAMGGTLRVNDGPRHELIMTLALAPR